MMHRIRALCLVVAVIYGSIALHEGGHALVLQVLGARPVMGPLGLVQKWNDPPLHPEPWIHVSFPEMGEGWFRLSRNLSDEEWFITLLAGPFMHFVLILGGFALALRGPTPRQRDLGVLLLLVNGLRWIPDGLALLRGSRGDAFFMSITSGIPQTWILLPFVAMEGVGFGLGLQLWRGNERRDSRIWLDLLVGGLLLTTGLSRLQATIVQGVDRGHPLFASFLGWSLPVWPLHILALVVLGREFTAREADV